MVAGAISELENEMELLGITGVEGKPTFLAYNISVDKLQNEVALTIEGLRSAGI